MENKNEVKKTETKWVAGENTHENIIYACFGGASNTGITTALASMEAVKELGLKKVAIGCLGGIPTDVPPVHGKTKAARKIITVDGCPMECSRKILEKAGYKVKSVMLVRYVPMKKKSLSDDISTGQVKPMMDYVTTDEVRKAKEVIVKAILED